MPEFTNNLKTSYSETVFYRPTVIHTEQNTLLTFRRHFKVRFQLFPFHSLSMFGCFPRSIAEFVWLYPRGTTQLPLGPRIGPDKAVEEEAKRMA